MEKKTLKFVDTKVTQSFADALNDWRDGTVGLSYFEYMTCFSFLAFCAVQDIVDSTGMVVKEVKDEVLKDMHVYLQMAGDSALDGLLEEIREREKEADAAEVADAEVLQEDNGYFEKFEDD